MICVKITFEKHCVSTATEHCETKLTKHERTSIFHHWNKDKNNAHRFVYQVFKRKYYLYTLVFHMMRCYV